MCYGDSLPLGSGFFPLAESKEPPLDPSVPSVIPKGDFRAFGSCESDANPSARNKHSKEFWLRVHGLREEAQALELPQLLSRF